jgi:hypothetical protein
VVVGDGGTVVGAGGTVAAGIAAGIGVGGVEGRGSAGLTITDTGTRTRTIAPTTMATIRHGHTTPRGRRITRLSPLLSDSARKGRRLAGKR